MYKKIANISKELQGIVHNTPIMTSTYLNEITGFEVYIKCEQFQRMGAFKFRGAFNAIRNLSREEKNKGVITHSSGNHAQAIALAGKLHNIKTVVVMPENAPQVKVNATKEYGAEIVFCHPSVSSREETTENLISQKGYTFIHPYDNQNVIEGAGTCAVEILDELGKLDAIIAPVGGGGLMSGTGIVGKESKNVEYVFGAEPLNADDAFKSIKEKKVLPQLNPNTIADGLRTQLSDLTYKYISNYVDEIILVTEQEIFEAMKILYERMKLVVEPSGAVSIAAVIKLSKNKDKLINGSKIACIISGGNVDLSGYFSELEQKVMS